MIFRRKNSGHTIAGGIPQKSKKSKVRKKRIFRKKRKPEDG